MTSSIQTGTKISFVLVENFTMIAFASAIEVLRMANQLSGERLYEWNTVSLDGQSVQASDALSINVDGSMELASESETVIVCGGVGVQQQCQPKMLNWLLHLDRQHITLGSLCTGSYILAKAGLLDGHPCAIHWEYMAGMQEEFSAIHVSNKIFTISEKRMTCTGGTAPMDMMLQMINRQHGEKLSAAISQMFICDRIRDSEEMQTLPLKSLVGASQPKLREIIMLMEANLEETISMDEMAGYVDLSRRQLERLFQKYLNYSPSRYYLHLRLNRAKQLLKQTNLSIIEVSIACGFVSTSHFSKCYRDYFGSPPKSERSAKFSMSQAPSSSNEPTYASVSLHEEVMVKSVI
ncbi:choline metabolism transcriptional regulator GbdR [Vibrio penaeicida]|uniref:AraC family transcriptional regulator n=1 Tax=Vibrio penaeicida TaxID=104609 RepID=A0AAV5NZ41_9VIBR|nr:GlxA family transcriptional regulator [Vibrio penaeicida]RTZ22688.1 GlxA family transcriptional regulator [Vibrio penaeicida]GLQ75642.1 AraC family transcriptional regulator [Vibrio penaeicida]